MSYTPYIPSVVIQNQVTLERIRLFVNAPARLLTPASYQIIDYELPEQKSLLDYEWSGLFTVLDDVENTTRIQSVAPLYVPQRLPQSPPTVLVPSVAYAGQLRVPVRLVPKV